MPMVAPTGTLPPAGTTIFANTPEAKASIWMVVLSVSISAIGSPFCTGSPSLFSQLAIVPSVMSNPIWGIVIFVAICVGKRAARTARSG